MNHEKERNRTLKIPNKTENKQEFYSEHPIKRLPPDILQLIFESAVPVSFLGFQRALLISHICQQWRILALASPTLWTYIQCSMRLPESILVVFWEEICARVKDVPVYVHIRGIFSQDNGQPSNCLQFCPLDKLSRIKSLRLEADGEEILQEIYSSAFVPPNRPFEVLTLHIRNRDYSEPQYEIVLDRFPRFGELSLLGFGGASISHSSLLNIHTLRLRETTLPVQPLLGRLSSLSFLELDWVSARSILRSSSRLNPLVIPNLLTLKALGAYVWITLIACPRLTTFIVDYITAQSHRKIVLNWISSHPTIRTLHITRLDAYPELAAAAPQLSELRLMDPDAIQSQGFRSEFPRLQKLQIIDPINKLTVETFEDLVTSRCLPAEDERNRREEGVTKYSLGVMVSLKKHYPILWNKSELYHVARKRFGFSGPFSFEESIFAEKYNPDEFTQMTLEWV